MPSTAMPWLIFSSMSAAPGTASTRAAARSRTASVRTSSRQAVAVTAPSVSMVRWSATAKEETSSISSPKKSTRTGLGSEGGKTSRMPPRTAYSPRDSTMSTRV